MNTSAERERLDECVNIIHQPLLKKGGVGIKCVDWLARGEGTHSVMTVCYIFLRRHWSYRRALQQDWTRLHSHSPLIDWLCILADFV